MRFCRPARSSRYASYSVLMACFAPTRPRISLRRSLRVSPCSDSHLSLSYLSLPARVFMISAALPVGTTFSWSFMASKRGATASKSASPRLRVTSSFSKEVTSMISLQWRQVALKEQASREKLLADGASVVATDRMRGKLRIPWGLKPDSLLTYIVCRTAMLMSGLRSVTATPRICRLGQTVIRFSRLLACSTKSMVLTLLWSQTATGTISRMSMWEEQSLPSRVAWMRAPLRQKRLSSWRGTMGLTMILRLKLPKSMISSLMHLLILIRLYPHVNHHPNPLFTYRLNYEAISENEGLFLLMDVVIY